MKTLNDLKTIKIKNIVSGALIAFLAIVSSHVVHAKSINCVTPKWELNIDDSMNRIFLSGEHAVLLTDLLLGHENVYVDHVIVPIGNEKISGDYIYTLDSLLPSEVEATVVYVDGNSEKVKFNGGTLSVRFNPFYNIGLDGSLKIVKSTSDKHISLNASTIECSDGMRLKNHGKISPSSVEDLGAFANVEYNVEEIELEIWINVQKLRCFSSQYSDHLWTLLDGPFPTLPTQVLPIHEYVSASGCNKERIRRIIKDTIRYGMYGHTKAQLTIVKGTSVHPITVSGKCQRKYVEHTKIDLGEGLILQSSKKQKLIPAKGCDD